MTRPYVTDHAVIRFCQRSQGIQADTTEGLRAASVDVDRVRQSISIVVQRGVQYGAAAVRWAGLRFLLDGVACVTVVVGQDRSYRAQDRMARQRIRHRGGMR